MIDWNRVDELRTEVGPEDFIEVVDLFLEEVDEIIDRFRNGAQEENLEETLHFLKGSALNIGFSHLATLCSHAGTAPSAIVAAYDAACQEFLETIQVKYAA